MLESLEPRRLLAITIPNAPVSGILTITGSSGDDEITINMSGTNIAVRDVPGNRTVNFAASAITQIVVNGGDGNDKIQSENPVTKALILNGGAGNDVLRGGGGNDTLNGNDGDDTLFGGTGGDTFTGGAGNDTDDYSARSANVIVTINSVVGDGEVGENDNVFDDIETVVGGAGNDAITGSAKSNLLVGNGGNDNLQGQDLDDTLDGGLGADVLSGGNGLDTARYTSRTENLFISLDGANNDGAASEGDNVSVEAIKGGTGNDSITGSAAGDYLDGGTGRDTIRGGSGNDTIIGSGTDDQLFGDAGADFIFAQDGIADNIDGGADFDSAQVDMIDTGGGNLLARAFAASAMPGDTAGTIDSDFNGNGFDYVDFSSRDDEVSAMGLQSDGKVIVVGTVYDDAIGEWRYGLARFNTDGTLDNDEVTGFGPDHSGVYAFGSGYGHDKANAMLILPDDSFIVAGQSGYGYGGDDVSLAKFDANGNLDAAWGNSFYEDGWSFVDLGGTDQINGLALMADGSVAAVGTTYQFNGEIESDQQSMVLADFDATTGELNESFNGGGYTTWNFGAFGADTEGNTIAIDSQGRIVVGGTTYTTSDSGDSISTDFLIARFNSDGTTDESFNSDFTPGFTTLDLNSIDTNNDVVTSLAIGADDSIVAAGYTETVNISAFVGGSGDVDTAIARFDSSGALDTTFNPEGSTPGVVTQNLYPGNGYGADSDDVFSGVTFDHEGRIVASGYTSFGGVGGTWTVTRFLQDGSLDQDFYDPSHSPLGGGIILHAVRKDGDFNDNDWTAGLAIDADGKIVVGGTYGSGYGNDDDFAVARFLSEAPAPENDILDGVINVEQLEITPEQIEQIKIDLHGSPELLGPIITDVNPQGLLKIDGTDGDDTIVVKQVGGTIFVTLNGAPAMEFDASLVSSIQLSGLGGNDSLTIDQSVTLPTSVYGGEGNDSLAGGGGDDLLDGGVGDDTYFFGAVSTTTNARALSAVPGQSDTIDDASGTDTLDFSALPSGTGVKVDLTGSGPIATQNGRTIYAASADVAASIENVIGGAGNDSIKANAFANKIIGGAGNDTMNGGMGDDTYIFGSPVGNETDVIVEAVANGGNDTVDFSSLSSTQNVIITLLVNPILAIQTGRIVQTTGSFSSQSIENAIGGAGNDLISGTTGANILRGGEGKDTIIGFAGNDTIYGDGGADNIQAGDGDDTADGGIGTDTIDGGTGNDNIIGGADADSITGGDGNDTVDAGAGNDTVVAGNGNDSVLGGADNDTISAGAGNDFVDAGAGVDTIDGGAGADNLIGGTENDKITGGTENDTLNGGAGNDTLDAGTGNDSVLGGDNNDSIIAGDGDDKVDAGAGNDTVSGGIGADSILGGNDNDSISAGDGNDTVDGGFGNDTINGENGNDSLLGGAGDDTISGGNNNDFIDGGAGKDKLSGDGNDDTFFTKDGEKDTVDGGSGTDTLLNINRDTTDVLTSIEKTT